MGILTEKILFACIVNLATPQSMASQAILQPFASWPSSNCATLEAKEKKHHPTK